MMFSRVLLIPQRTKSHPESKAGNRVHYGAAGEIFLENCGGQLERMMKETGDR